MDDPRPENYDWTGFDPGRVEIRCQRCGAYLGRRLQVDGITYLVVGNVKARMITGKCNSCDQDFRHTAADVIMERITKKLPPM